MERLAACFGSNGAAKATICVVDVNDADAAQGKPRRCNQTSTTKYNLFTYLPKALFEQYRRLANIYFTLVAALSLTSYSPIRPWTTFAPLVFVLGISLVKEALEDFKRYRGDVEVNSRVVVVLNAASGKYEERLWQAVCPGEVLLVRKDEAMPADLLLLCSSAAEGTCYVETMNLDGETNLKMKSALDATRGLDVKTLPKLRARMTCEAPNARLYNFTGNLEVLAGGTGGKGAGSSGPIPMSPNEVLLRGCSLRNTEYIYGAVIYAGHETKVFMNATKAPSKRSKMERGVDMIILFMFGLLLVMCLVTSIYFGIWTKARFDQHWYMAPTRTIPQYDPKAPVTVGLISFLVCFILYGYLIPISLYVSIEIVKVVQSMVFINHDLSMYHAETDTPALARTSNLNEELGMVNTVLSDKTGTLTRNVMEFFKASIAGVSYGSGITEIEKSNCARRGVAPPAAANDPAAASYYERFFNFYDSRLMGIQWAHETDAHTIEMFFRLLAVCHTVIPDGPNVESKIKYEAESPDEAALVVAAKAFGFFFFKRTQTSVVVRERTGRGTKDVEYEVLNVIEFNSTRKRMSVIVRDASGKLIVFCKGADTVIYERLDPKHPANAALKVSTSQHMEEYGSAGLRTLCLSYAELDPNFYQSWDAQWREAKTSLVDHDAKLEALGELVETNLRLLGCTAIEDKLQEGVQRSIEQLAAAGIRLWVLTGDKMETAVNIGYACSLVTDDMRQFRIQAESPEAEALEAAGDAGGAARLMNLQVEQQLQEVQAACSERRAAAPASASTSKGSAGEVFAMIIDGKALSYAMSDRLAQAFLAAGGECAAVLCCRVSPLQKAQVTSLVRSRGDITLAIGDGANDVGMIQKAHIGVGISGQEGMQAVMAADYAIAQFRYLVPLLLVHGRWSYVRLARMIVFFFYKNLIFGMSIFVYNALTHFSGQYMYNDTYMTLYNVIFTFLTPIAIGLFDRDVDKAYALQYPQLYIVGQRNELFNLTTNIKWILRAAFHCAIIMIFVLAGAPSTASGHSGGQTNAMYETGILMYTVIVLTVHLKIMTLFEQWTWLHHAAVWVSVALWWIFIIVYPLIVSYDLSADLYQLFVPINATNPQYWLIIIITPVFCVLPDYFIDCVWRHMAPTATQIVQELQSMNRRGRVHSRGLIESAPSNSSDRSGSSLMQPLQMVSLPAHTSQDNLRPIIPPSPPEGQGMQTRESAALDSPPLAHKDSGKWSLESLAIGEDHGSLPR